ncbi:MAG TPA: glycosyltransferase family 4 protein [Verrucomicrobiae bacterium]|nr:glycosyltransferase family 4 protein [Verrucomicrobiae bacterium]
MMNESRLLVLCDVVGAEGGSESAMERYLPALQRAGFDVRVMARRVTDPRRFGVPARALSWGGENDEPSGAAADAIVTEIENEKIGVVLSSNVFDAAVLAAARSAKRCVVHVRDHRVFCPNGDRLFPSFPAPCDAPMGGACVVNSVLHGCVCGPRARTIERLRARERVASATRRHDAFVVSSRFMARLCERNGIGSERIHVLPPPVSDGSLADEIAPAPAQPRVLFAGRIVPAKGLQSLIRALARIGADRRPVLRVAGRETPELERCVQIAHHLGVQLEVLGWCDGDALLRAIDDVHAVVVPSLWPEPYGLLGAEAQARGRPAAAYATGGIPEWVGDAGVCVPRGDEAALARAIAAVTDPSRWPSFSAAARQRANRHDLSSFGERLRTVLCAS